MNNLGVPDCAVVRKAVEEEDRGFMGTGGPGGRGGSSGVAVGDVVWGADGS